MRTFHMTVAGDSVELDSAVAGVRGSGNVDKLVVSFDPSWEGYAKSACWWDAHGVQAGEPETLTFDKLSNYPADTLTYILVVPPEALRHPGRCRVVIDGWKDGALARTVAQELDVVDAPDPAPARELAANRDTTLQAQIDGILGTVAGQTQAAQEAAQTAGERAEDAKETLEAAREVYSNVLEVAGDARDQAQEAGQQASSAYGYAQEAKEAQASAERAAAHSPYVGEGGTWMIWDQAEDGYRDTGIQAEGKTGETGRDGVLTTLGSGVFAMGISEEGHLLVAVNEKDAAPPLEIDEEGHLIYKINT